MGHAGRAKRAAPNPSNLPHTAIPPHSLPRVRQAWYDVGLKKSTTWNPLIMATVFIPTQLRDATDSTAQVEVEGARVRDIVDAMEKRFPGVRARLCKGDQLSPSLQVSIDGVISTRGLAARVPEGGEVHFLPAIGGGS